MYKILKSLSPTRKYITFLYDSWRHAGHSKWQNIRHIKAEKDGQKSALFTKLRRNMEVAIQGKYAIEGKSADPSTNVQLAHVIEQAKKANMPASTVNDYIKSLKEKALGAKSEMKIIELSGPGGSAFIICAFTSTPLQLQASINTLIRKAKGSFSLGTVAHLFDCKSVIETDIPSNTSLEDAVNLAIELELEDVLELKEDEQHCLQFTGAPSMLHKFKTQLATRNYKVQSARISYTPLIQIPIQEGDLESVNLMYTKLQVFPEIVDIFDNVAWPEDL